MFVFTVVVAVVAVVVVVVVVPVLVLAVVVVSPVTAALVAALLAVLAAGSLGQLALQLLGLALLLGLDVNAGLQQVLQHGAQRRLPLVDARRQLLPLPSAEHSEGDLVHEEHALLLRQLTLDQTGADSVNGPHLNLVLLDLQGFGNGGVGDLAAGSGGSQAGKRQQAHLAVQLLAIQAFLLNEALVLVVEVVVVLEVLLGKDLEKLGVGGVGVAQGLDTGNATQLLEEVVGAGQQRGLDGLQSQALRSLGRKLLAGVGVERAQSLEDVLEGSPIG